ncbi:hypothetical protein ACQKNX_07730 [Lysinibacillus sp. NPDC093712]|uniref:hypothetical protein n=1 Tax=Lysinibacillus sp. NPDC093712 TaxID=3390579 RepID=UPI003D016546
MEVFNIRKYDERCYEDMGFFIKQDKWSEGYKVIRDEDGWVFDMVHKDKASAQEWIESMVEMINNSKVNWSTYNLRN